MIIQMALAVMLLLPSTLFGQALTDVQFLVLTQIDGTVSKFALGDSPIITYSAGDVVVTCNGQTFKTSMEGVANCTFATEKVPSGIENLQAEGSKDHPNTPKKLQSEKIKTNHYEKDNTSILYAGMPCQLHLRPNLEDGHHQE